MKTEFMKLFGIGEVLWDLLPGGRQMGGAPANFAYHARALGADGRVISRVGNDELGHEILARLKKLDVPIAGITVDQTHATGTVSVDVSPDGQPCFTIHEDVAWDHLTPDPALLASVKEADALCFGSLAQRCEPSRGTILQLVAHSPASALRVFDVNLRQHFYSRDLLHTSAGLANVIKLNDAELPIVSGLFGFRGSPKEQMAAIFDHYELRLLACTRGSEGSMIYDGKEWGEFPGLPASVVDTVGAGDSFTAALTVGMLLGWSLEKLGRIANEVAAYVCSCAGATPPLPAHLRAHFQPQPAVLHSSETSWSG
ncbi:MAG: iolC [Chthoniobacteraceae bacterium]|nr:iolC [Chthoniobacteraceae bacterium]